MNLCLGAAMLAAAAAASAQTPAPAAEPVAAIFQSFKPSEPGCAFGVMRDGALVRSGAYGMSDLQRHEPLTSRSTFNLASLSKQFTAFAVLLLEHRGRLRLDDSIRTFVPELGEYAQPVTLRHLLHHSGGLRDYIDLLLLAGQEFETTSTQKQALQLLAAQTGANSAANAEYAYSNTGYFLLGLVVERRSGQSLAEFSAERIFKPLQMNDTSIVDRYPAHVPRLARGYAPAQDGFVINESTWEETGDGQVHTSIEDWQRWERNFETARVGGAALLAKLVETGVLESGARTDYAGGLRVENYRGLQMIAHGGDWVGYVAHARRFPAQRFAATVLCNRSDADPESLTAALAEHFLAQQMTQPIMPKEVAALASQGGVAPAQMPTGLYRNASTAGYVRLYSDGSLGELGSTSAPSQLVPVDHPPQSPVRPARIYRIGADGHGYAVFKAAASDAKASIVMQDSIQPYTYTHVQAWRPAGLECLAGHYKSVETPAALMIAATGSELRVTYGKQQLVVAPAGAHELVGAGVPTEGIPFALRFAADGSRNFQLFTPGVRGMRFEGPPGSCTATASR